MLVSTQGRGCFGGWGFPYPPFLWKLTVRACSGPLEINSWVWAQSLSAVCTKEEANINMLVPKQGKNLYSAVKQCHCLHFGKPGQEKQNRQVRRKGLREGGENDRTKWKKNVFLETYKRNKNKQKKWVPAVRKLMDVEVGVILEIIRKERDGKSSRRPSISPPKHASFCIEPTRGIHSMLWEHSSSSWGERSVADWESLLPDSQPPWWKCQGGEKIPGVLVSLLIIEEKHCHWVVWC